MKYEEVRVIYFIPPSHLIKEVMLALRRAEVKVREILRETNSWRVKGVSNYHNKVTIILSYERKTLKDMEIFGEVFISRIEAFAEGEQDFIEKLRTKLDVSLLRVTG